MNSLAFLNLSGEFTYALVHAEARLPTAIFQTKKSLEVRLIIKRKKPNQNLIGVIW